eukprot:364009-Chlamydomonas_euryale.AAC.1
MQRAVQVTPMGRRQQCVGREDARLVTGRVHLGLRLEGSGFRPSRTCTGPGGNATHASSASCATTSASPRPSCFSPDAISLAISSESSDRLNISSNFSGCSGLGGWAGAAPVASGADDWPLDIAARAKAGGCCGGGGCEAVSPGSGEGGDGEGALPGGDAGAVRTRLHVRMCATLRIRYTGGGLPAAIRVPPTPHKTHVHAIGQSACNTAQILTLFPLSPQKHTRASSPAGGPVS